MNHDDHVALLRGGIETIGGAWADFGSGTGAFTLALADLIGPTGVIYSIDQDRFALAQQERALRDRFPNTIVHTRLADFTRPIDLPAARRDRHGEFAALSPTTRTRSCNC